MNPTTHQPLTDDEFARLSGFLDAIGASAMNIETLDGYFAALICGPDMVPPSEYLPQIWGEDFAFGSDEQAAGITGLLMRHWNTIAAELRHTLDEPNVYLPVLLAGDDGVARGNDWAHGFMRGVRTRAASWGELIHDEDSGGPLLPIMMLPSGCGFFQAAEFVCEPRQDWLAGSVQSDRLKSRVCGCENGWKP